MDCNRHDDDSSSQENPCLGTIVTKILKSRMPSNTAGAFNYSEGRPTRSTAGSTLCFYGWLPVTGRRTQCPDLELMCMIYVQTDLSHWKKGTITSSKYLQPRRYVVCTQFARECLSLSKGIWLANLRVVYSGLAPHPTRNPGSGERK